MPDEIEEDGDASGEGPWKFAQPSAQVIQKHYVNARVHELNKAGDDGREKTIDEILKRYADQIKGKSREKKRRYCGGTYDFLTSVLQGRELTINLKASSWFGKENPYETYSHMYERGIDSKTGQMVLNDDDKLNPANLRSQVDDRITFPQHWADQQGPMRRGLDPRATQPGQTIAHYMLSGTAIPRLGDRTDDYLQKTDKDGQYTSKNPKLNPKAKQVFTALNYGRRHHGSSTQYGRSYLVLNPNLKVDAIYFSGDTFYIPGANHQATYQTLGTLYLHAKPLTREALIQSCLQGIRLEDTSEAMELVEAHIFQEVRFDSSVRELRLEETDNPTVIANAQKFCNKWGIHLERL